VDGEGQKNDDAKQQKQMSISQREKQSHLRTESVHTRIVSEYTNWGGGVSDGGGSKTPPKYYCCWTSFPQKK